MSTDWKVPFEWRSPNPPEDDPRRAGWSWTTGSESAAPIELVAVVPPTHPPRKTIASSTRSALKKLRAGRMG
jgi:hypothetical protein